MAKMVYDPETKKMVPMTSVAKAKAEAGYERFSLDGKLAEALKGFAKMDGWDFSGKSKVALKDKDGNVRKNANGETLYEQETITIEDKPVKRDKVISVAVSPAKVSNAIRNYVEIAVKDFIAAREAAETPAQ